MSTALVRSMLSKTQVDTLSRFGILSTLERLDLFQSASFRTSPQRLEKAQYYLMRMVEYVEFGLKVAYGDGLKEGLSSQWLVSNGPGTAPTPNVSLFVALRNVAAAAVSKEVNREALREMGKRVLDMMEEQT